MPRAACVCRADRPAEPPAAAPAMLPRWAKQPPGASPRAAARLREPGRASEPRDCRLPALLLDPDRTSSHMISADDAEYPREYRTLGNGTRRFSNVGLVHTSERRHTVIAAQSLEALTGLQKTEMERKRDAFMDHLKSKYPQHALALRGQQERLRDQQPNYWSFKTRSSRHSQGSQPGLADQAKLSFASAESLETMSEAELPLAFNRMNRFRQSLPLSRSASQTKLRSPGVLFLQFGDETRRVHITHEISSMDTLHALIVHMFPQKLTMGMLKSPNTAILIKDESRNVFYELEDVRDIQDRSIIKIYRKEPLYASFPASHITNGDLRRDMVYTSRESSPTRRLNNISPASHLASGSPPPVLQSSSPSRSRMSYSGGRPPSYAGSPVHHGERLSSLPPAQGVSPSPSAILERRDVKPDEDLAGKNVVLVKNEGLYADPYGMVHEGRLSITSTQSLAGMGDPFGYSGGLYKRGSVRSLSTYSAAALQTELEDSLYKPNAPIYSDTYGPGLGFRMPPSSPQKMVEPGQSPHSPYSGPPSRSSPVRQSFRKDSCSSVFMDSPVGKTRNPSSSGPPELFPGPGERPLSGFGSPGAAKDTETRERMEAMEKQIASLTGLVQSALLRGSEAETPSEKTEATNGGTPPSASTSRSGMGTPVPAPPPPSATSTPAGQPTAITRLHMQLHLHDLQQNASDLRNQLQQLKKLQLQNQETVKSLLRRTETELSVRVTDTMRKHEDPLQRQRSLVEEERLRYLNEEELISQQLNDLEKSVEKIQKDLAHNQRLVPAQELEEKAVVLKQLGETLTDLKAQFPGLQSKMRVVLRVEVEAVKFLKEEPNRLDGLLKRCKTVTDTLAQIRRQVDEGVWSSPSSLSQSPKKVAPETDFGKGLELEMPTSPPVSLHHLTGTPEPLGMPGFAPQPQSHPGKSNNPSRAPEMVAAKTQTGPETPSKKSADKAVSVEAAERDWEEKRAALTQYSAKDINRLLEETQAELMKAIPDLEFAAKHKQTPGSGSAASTPEHKPSKAQHTPKSGGKGDPNGRRGSDELTVPRYRTEKPSKSPPPPPPRRSFPSSHGLTTTRSGEVIVTSKKEPGFIKKAESEELETPKPQVKLRRAVSEVVRPASTPPIIASAVKDDDDEDRIIAELEVFQRSSASPLLPEPRCDPLEAVSPGHPEPWPRGAEGWKEPLAPAAPAGRAFSLPQIVLTEWVSEPPSPEAEPEPWVAPGSAAARGQLPPEGTRGGRAAAPGSPPESPLAQEAPPAPQPPGSASRAFPPAAPPFPRDKTGAQRGDAALGPASRPGGGDKACPQSAVAAQPPRSRGAGAGAAAAALPSVGAGIIPQIPAGHGDPQRGARLAPGHSAGAPKAAWREESPGAHPGDPAPRAAGPSREEQPRPERIPARPSPAAAPPGWDRGAPAAGGDPGALCRGRLSPAAPGKKEIYEDTYQRLDSLEETIRELEMTISEISSHPAVEFAFPKGALGSQEAARSLGDLGHGGCDGDTALDLSQARDGAAKSPSASRTKPALLPKPQLPPGTPQSGGVSIPAMKVVNPASRLKQGQQGSPDKGKHIKQRMEYMRIQGQQQATRPSKEASETSPTVSEKPAAGRTSIPVLTSFGARNSSISF
ncbi:SRC kinase signaling inhibitor 1 isoform X5 [Passer montanus]|uniref:SRC kinase signaling inhibitor 1 isoform X5 n=1 Tax=Passer montanus TaxID=9160 RepID=UPI0019607205|nr:SRC kinase signaling inhibitor 1 isoform X5 [Passer montanus]